MSTNDAPVPDPSGDEGSRRGRPPGTGKLTPEVTATIENWILAGATDYSAAEAADVDERTYREWVSRGEGRHPTRPWTPEYGEFAMRIRRAKAQARVAREVHVATHDAKHWLKYMARSTPGRPGWSEPVPEEAVQPGTEGPIPTSLATPEEVAETLNILRDSGALDQSPTQQQGDGSEQEPGQAGSQDEGQDP